MSSVSRRILRHTKITDVVEKRRTNYEGLSEIRIWRESLQSIRISGKYLPLGISFLVNEVKDLHLVLRERGIPATTWSGVIHASLPLEQFPNAQFLYENLVFCRSIKAWMSAIWLQ